MALSISQIEDNLKAIYKLYAHILQPMMEKSTYNLFVEYSKNEEEGIIFAILNPNNNMMEIEYFNETVQEESLNEYLLPLLRIITNKHHEEEEYVEPQITCKATLNKTLEDESKYVVKATYYICKTLLIGQKELVFYIPLFHELTKYTIDDNTDIRYKGMIKLCKLAKSQSDKPLILYRGEQRICYNGLKESIMKELDETGEYKKDNSLSSKVEVINIGHGKEKRNIYYLPLKQKAIIPNMEGKTTAHTISIEHALIFYPSTTSSYLLEPLTQHLLFPDKKNKIARRIFEKMLPVRSIEEDMEKFIEIIASKENNILIFPGCESELSKRMQK